MYSKHEATRLGAELADVLCEFWPQAEGISMAVAPAFDWQFPTSQVFQTRWGGQSPDSLYKMLAVLGGNLFIEQPPQISANLSSG